MLELREITHFSFSLCPSDQTDPFNRSPLTMDQIRPNTELKEKIQRWLAERKQQKEQLE